MTGVVGLKMRISSWGEVALDKKELKALMRAAGNEVKSKTGKLISRNSGAGRVYRGGGGGSSYRGGQYRAGRYQASAPGEPPVAVTRTLKTSMKTYVWPDGNGFAVRQRAFYALFLEAGAEGGTPGSRAAARRQRRAQPIAAASRVLEPRPSLDVVLAAEEKQLQARVRKAFDQGMTWRQTR